MYAYSVFFSQSPTGSQPVAPDARPAAAGKRDGKTFAGFSAGEDEGKNVKIGERVIARSLKPVIFDRKHTICI